MICFHNWIGIGAKHHIFMPKWMVLRMGPGDVADMKPNETTVLYRCAKCGISKTETLDGAWTLDQVNGK